MNILDDPKLTAYALDELRGAEKAAMEATVAASPEAQEFVREIRLLSGNLRAEYDAELEIRPQSQNNIVPLAQEDEPWTISRRLALAAAIALCACLGALAVGTMKRGGVVRGNGSGRLAGGRTVTQLPAANNAAVDAIESAREENEPPPPPAAATEFALAEPQPRAKQAPKGSAGLAAESSIRLGHQPFNTARYAEVNENSFLAAASNPLSTFSIDVDTASYANIRRFLESGSLPPKDAVRVEEMINYFSYDYPQPNDSAPFSINLDAASCPWAPSHRLVRIGLKGKEMPNEKRPSSNLVFLLDVSGSMEPENRLPLVKQAMRLLVGKLGENDHVAIVVYAGASGLALPSTTGDHKERILAALENLQAGGSTNGAQGIELAYQTAAEHFIKGGVNRVILATDGDFNIGTTSEGDLVRLIEEKAKIGVFLSVLGVGDDNLNDSMMQKLADKGNGNYAYLDSLGEAQKVLVRQINGTLVTIAKDVKIQVEFNPARVASYRLIGYEKRLLRKEDFNNDKIDAGEIGAGHTVTALYEVVPVGAEPNPAASIPAVDPLKYQHTPASAKTSGKGDSPELLTVKLRYKEPDDDTSKLLERSFVDDKAPFASAAPDLKFAAAVAEFGMILRDSEFKGDGTLGTVREWAQEGKGADANGYRIGFLELVQKAQQLKARR
ncbi:MAG TPA: VWA domain-containing protein [Chthoniobacterales bacterium]|jgi:Ca-activated chloride channel family protein